MDPKLEDMFCKCCKMNENWNLEMNGKNMKRKHKEDSTPKSRKTLKLHALQSLISMPTLNQNRTFYCFMCVSKCRQTDPHEAWKWWPEDHLGTNTWQEGGFQDIAKHTQENSIISSDFRLHSGFF